MADMEKRPFTKEEKEKLGYTVGIYRSLLLGFLGLGVSLIIVGLIIYALHLHDPGVSIFFLFIGPTLLILVPLLFFSIKKQSDDYRSGEVIIERVMIEKYYEGNWSYHKNVKCIKLKDIDYIFTDDATFNLNDGDAVTVERTTASKNVLKINGYEPLYQQARAPYIVELWRKDLNTIYGLLGFMGCSFYSMALVISALHSHIRLALLFFCISWFVVIAIIAYLRMTNILPSYRKCVAKKDEKYARKLVKSDIIVALMLGGYCMFGLMNSARLPVSILAQGCMFLIGVLLVATLVVIDGIGRFRKNMFD